jgi:hypothetical protein
MRILALAGGEVRTAAKGTLVARPVRITLHTRAAVVSSLGPNGEGRLRQTDCVDGKPS